MKPKKDLAPDTIVMCRPYNSRWWRVQYYVANGTTKSEMDTNTRGSGWAHIVPLDEFKPDSPDWRPPASKAIDWANFGEEEK